LRRCAVAVGALALLGLGIVASTPASAQLREPTDTETCDRPLPPVNPGQPVNTGCAPKLPKGDPTHHEGSIDGKYVVHFNHTQAYTKKICLKTTTSIEKRPDGVDRQCSGRKGLGDGAFSLAVAYTEGDSVYVDFEMFTGLGNSSITKDNIVVTGAKSCSISGILHAGKLDCDTPINARTFSVPPLQAYTVNVADQNNPTMSLINLLAWCVTAASVAGLIITGVNMALQMRRGEPGEFSEHWRGFLYVGAACVLGMTAAPIVEYLNLVK
jgi:hypothetical protein